MKKQALVTVQVLTEALARQLYSSRNDMMQAYKMDENEEAVGYMVSGAGVLIRNKVNNRLCMVWPYSYCLGQGMNPKNHQTEQRQILDKLPQLFSSSTE